VFSAVATLIVLTTLMASRSGLLGNTSRLASFDRYQDGRVNVASIAICGADVEKNIVVQTSGDFHLAEGHQTCW
jgi:hypothetical protein